MNQTYPIRENKQNPVVKIVSLGGFGSVTNNMFVYETEKDIIIVDCGVGFPTDDMLGVDLVIPDISYLLPKKDKIRGIILSHGHDDHIGALPYILPQLPNLPIYGSKWALALANAKLKEVGRRGQMIEVSQGKKISLGQFSVEFVNVTHSIPETLHLVIRTPVGVFYHAADFKLDLNPVMGEPSDQNLIRRYGSEGVFCLLSDCLRSEKPGFTPSETKLGETFERELATTKGRFIVTTISSNISRLKLAIDASLKNNRKVALFGRSIDNNVRLAMDMKYWDYPKETFLLSRKIKKMDPRSLTLLVAGSQGQVGSALERMVSGEHEIKLGTGDKVVFSTDYIPGNEVAIYTLIDQLLKAGVEVVYPDTTSDLHVSGHGQSEDLKKLIELTKPWYLVPIGGNYRHMVAYRKLANSLGYPDEKILMPGDNQVMEFYVDGKAKLGKPIPAKTVMVDALGVGDVGNVVLRDRQVLASEGIVVAIAQLDKNNYSLISDPDIITRGFVYAKESEKLLEGAKNQIRDITNNQKTKTLHFLRREIQERLEKYFFEMTGRQPMVLPFVIEI